MHDIIFIVFGVSFSKNLVCLINIVKVRICKDCIFNAKPYEYTCVYDQYQTFL